MKARWFFLALLFGGHALAEGPADYAYGWPLVTEGEGPAWQVELGPEVYAASVDPLLRDVEVFDSRGRAVPAGPLVQDASLLPPTVEAVPVFELRRGLDDDAASLRLRIDGASPGALRVDAAWSEAKDAPVVLDHLLDLRRIRSAVDGLVIVGEGAFRFRFAVEASEDLERWRSVVPSASVLRIARGEEILERLEVELPATHSSFLRLRTLEGEPPQEFVAKVRIGPEASRLLAPLRWVEAQLVTDTVEGERVGVHVYEIPGPLPVERLRLVPSEGASLANVRVKAQSQPDAPAIEVTRFPLMGVDVGGVALPPEDVRFTAVSATTWRLESSPPLPAPPKLSLGYRPLRLVFLAQGSAPYLLVAGSLRQRRTDAPISALLFEVGKRQGKPWEPPAARLGERIVLEGEAARREPVPWRRYVLWGVLVAGAGLVAVLGLGVLRRSGREH